MVWLPQYRTTDATYHGQLIVTYADPIGYAVADFNPTIEETAAKRYVGMGRGTAIWNWGKLDSSSVGYQWKLFLEAIAQGQQLTFHHQAQGDQPTHGPGQPLAQVLWVR